MESHKPLDSDKLDLKLGDWVRVIMAPLSIQGMPEHSLVAFSNAIGHTFQIQDIDETGCLELEYFAIDTWETIYIEPYCVRRFRRYKKLSKAFQKHLAWLKSIEDEQLMEIEFEIYLKPRIDLDDFAKDLISKDIAGGFGVWPEQRKIKGNIEIEADEPNAYVILESAKIKIQNKAGIDRIEISEVQLKGG